MTDEDNPLSLSINYSDIDNDLEIDVLSSVSGFNFEINQLSSSRSELIITPPLNFYGLTTISLTATEVDGELSVSKC